MRLSFVRSHLPRCARRLAFACVLVAAARPVGAQTCAITTDYQGLTSVHLSYRVAAMPAGASQMRLVVRRGGSSTDTTLETVPLIGVTHQFHDRNLIALESERYAIVGVPTEGGPPVEHCARQVTLSSTIQGAPTADDTIDGASAGISLMFIGQVTLNPDITLTFGGSTIDLLQIASPATTGILTGSFVMTPGATLVVSGAVIDALRVADTSPVFVGVTFRGRVEVAGGAPIFRDCEFGEGASLFGRTSAAFTGNVFASSLYVGSSSDPLFPAARNRSWYEAEAPTPTISDNSFVGSTALSYPNMTDPAPNAAIPIGANYYGDVGGPTYAGLGFLEGRGAVVIRSSDCGGQCPSRTVFQLAAYQTTGRHRSDRGSFPRFSLKGLVVGQNTLELAASGTPGSNAILRAGRETLLSAEIVTTDEAVSGVDVYAMVDGVRVNATNPSMMLHRDSAPYGGAGYARASLTHNFILPAHTSTTARVELWLDATRVAGYDAPAPAPRKLYEETLTFASRLARPFRICVRPARVAGWGTGMWPVASSVVATLDQLIPQWLPVAGADLDIRECPALDYTFGVWTVWALVQALATEAYRVNALAAVNRQWVADVTVVVVEAGILGSADGANQIGRRRAIIVDAGKPGAVIHELGHTAGLSNTIEDYNWSPEHGTPVGPATAFSPEPTAPAPASTGDRARIFHMVGPLNRTYSAADAVIDVMGDGLRTTWPSMATIRAIGGYIAGVTNRVPAPVVPSGRVAAAAVPGPGMRRLLISSTTEKVTVQGPLGPMTRWRLVQGTTRALVLGADVVEDRPPAAESDGDPAALDALDANGQIVATVLFGVANSIEEPAAQSQGFWAATFDVPDTAVFYRIRTQATGNFPIAVYDASLTTRLTAPTAGSTIGDNLRVAWEDTYQYRGPTPVPEWVSVQPLQHHLEYSLDGATWAPLSATLVGNEITLPSSLLPGGVTLSLRLVVSDGLRRAVAQVDHLSVPRRRPHVRLLSPRPTDRGTPDSLWRFEALAWDDDGTPVIVTWTSDRDGAIGTGLMRTSTLRTGTHRITCRAADGDGQIADASVDIVVGDLNTLDLSMPADAITVAPAGLGPVTPAPTWALAPQVRYMAVARVRAPGAMTSATLRLYLTAPDRAEALLAEQALTALPFAEMVIAASFAAGGAGAYDLRAEIAAASPNADPSNDQRTWRFTARTNAPGPGDTDGDTLPDAWELTFGLDATAAGVSGADGDPDNDGVSNLEEHQRGTHPRGFHTRYFAEGATSSFLGTTLALLNPGDTPAVTHLRFQRPGGSESSSTLTIGAHSRATVDPRSLSGLSEAEFSTTIESDRAVIVDRTVLWDTVSAYGAHAETSIVAPALTWYLAEGTTVGAFNLFYLVQNPNPVEAQVRVRFLRPTGAPLVKAYTLPANSRNNIWVNQEEFAGLGRALASTDVSGVIECVDGHPVIVERALYLDLPGQPFGAGHESAGVTSPATQWFLAEGATGDFFDLFVLIANPGDTDATVEANYLLPDGSVIARPYTVRANSRFNIWVDFEDARLADTAVSTTIRSTNDVPVIVERALWWPATGWYEAHNSPGATTTGTRWALAEGEVGGPRNTDTYILLANTSPTPGTVVVTLIFEDGTTSARTFSVSPKSRFNVDVRAEFPVAADRRFGALVESGGAVPAQIVVERAMYWNALGQPWAAGTNALGTRLQ